MFSLIVTVLAIVLVVGLAAAMMYYGGGDTFTSGKNEANAAQAVNEMNQIRSALVAYQANEGGFPQSLEDLTPKYLSALPDGWGGTVPENVDGLAVESRMLKAGTPEREQMICELINERLGNGSTPLCTEISSSFMGCCETP